MPRYEHAKTSSFWEIEKSEDGKAFTVRWGKLGADGRSTTKRHADSYACTVAYDELIAEKRKLGYTLVKPKLSFATKSNAALEATLCELIDDPARWTVYADWLQEAGDVRGEIIALGLADRTDEANALIAANADVLWGDAWAVKAGTAFEGLTWLPGWQGATRMPLELAFKHEVDPLGFVDSIELTGLDEEGHVAKAMYDVLASPIGRFTRAIELAPCGEGRYSGASGQPNYNDVAAAIARAKPAALRRLTMRSGGYQLSWTSSGKLGPLLATTPNLENLSIDLGGIDLGDRLQLPNLETLRLETGGLGAGVVLAIADASWPVLWELVLFLGTQNYGCDVTGRDIEALLANPFPQLESLALCNSEIPGEIVAAIVRSPLLARLRVLDLSKSTMIDDDAAPILENLDRFQHLERLDLSNNYLSPEFELRLVAAFGARVSVYESRYDEMVAERARYGNEPWATDASFRYTRFGE